MIVYSTSRLSRELFHALAYERELARAGVEVFYAPTPTRGPPRHVDSKRNTSGKWSKSTIRSILENHVYTGRLYWNRLDFRAVKQGEGPLVRRSPEDWIKAEQRHEALVSEEDFERVQMEMKARSAGQGGNRRRYKQKHFYQLRGIVHCATGHNPLRMQGKPPFLAPAGRCHRAHQPRENRELRAAGRARRGSERARDR